MTKYEDYIEILRHSDTMACPCEETIKFIKIDDFFYSTPIDLMIKLIKYQDYLKSNIVLNFVPDRLILILKHNQSVTNNNGSLYYHFNDAKFNFQERYQNLFQNTILNDKLELILKKIISLEQFQANILDKLTVFAEMLDNKKDDNQ